MFAGVSFYVAHPVLQQPQAAMVGGIETSSASRAGVHWGDVITEVNGIDLQGKTAQQLEALFCARTSTVINLTVERLGEKKSFMFQLEEVAMVLKENHLRLVNNILVPEEISAEDLFCETHAQP